MRNCIESLLPGGDEVEILMKQADGWTKVRFNGEVGYIKTEVLK